MESKNGHQSQSTHLKLASDKEISYLVHWLALLLIT